MVAFADDDGILRIQIVEAGKSGTEHKDASTVAEAAFIVEFLQSGLYRAMSLIMQSLGSTGSTWRKASQRVFHRNGIDDQLRLEVLDFLPVW